MKIELTDENVLDLLLFKIIGSDGNVSYDDQKHVADFLKEHGYTSSHFFDVMNHLNSLSTDAIRETLDEAINKVNNYSDSHKAYIKNVLGYFTNSKNDFDDSTISSAQSVINSIT